jgi:hypothetical protein
LKVRGTENGLPGPQALPPLIHAEPAGSVMTVVALDVASVTPDEHALPKLAAPQL